MVQDVGLLGVRAGRLDLLAGGGLGRGHGRHVVGPRRCQPGVRSAGSARSVLSVVTTFSSCGPDCRADVLDALVRTGQRPWNSALPGPLSRKLRHPDLLVLGAEQAREQRRLQPQAVGEAHVQPVVDGELRRPQRDRRTVDELPGEGDGLGVDVVGRDDLVDQPDLERLRRPHVPAGEDEVLGLGRADQPGEPLGAAGARDDPEQDLRLSDAGVVPGDAEVRGHREFQPAAERVAGDRGDDRLRDAGQLGEGVLEPGRRGGHLAGRHGRHLLDVGAGREDLLAAVEDDGAHVVAAADLERSLAELVLQRPAQRVHRRAVQPDGRDPVLDLDPDVLHGELPRSCAMPKPHWSAAGGSGRGRSRTLAAGSCPAAGRDTLRP